MGLDMYLTKKSYVKNWRHMKDDEKHEIIVIKGSKVRSDIKPERISYIVEEVCYWRKANAIHDWFVQNVQKGIDDCGDYYVDREKLEELKNACKEVLTHTKLKKGAVADGYTITSEGGREYHYRDGEVIANPEVAKKVLPTKDGFFFGGTDYDEGYYDDLKHTFDTLIQILKEDGDGDYYYHASW